MRPAPHADAGLFPCILACSPRRGGNCDAAAALFREGLASGGTAGRAGARTVFLRDHTVAPCVACGHCSRYPGVVCPFEKTDSSTPLLDMLVAAPALCIIAPIYFYHVPAIFKALIDRGQAFWTQRAAASVSTAQRKAHVILIAARPRGEQLFEGSLLTLRYWLDSFGIAMQPPLTLKSLDEPGALRADPEAREAIARYAAEARQDWLC